MTTLVIGAGMAGLAAAATLHAAGEQVIILEARHRMGGRVHTDREFSDVPVELGAEFIHGDTAPTWLLARQLGLTLHSWQVHTEALVRLASGSLHPGEAALAADPAFAQARFLDFPETPTLPGEDLETYLRRTGVSEAAIAYLARGWAHAEGEALRGIDAQSAVEQFADTSNGDGNWRILNGYSRLIEHVAQGLDIRLGVEVQCIDWSDPVVRVVAADGTTHSADHVIITLPLGVLKAGRVQFVPALPAAKQDAIDRLASAPVIKLVYRFAEPVLPEGVFALIVPGNPCVWWSPSVAQPTDDVVLTAFVTGDRAREMLALGETAALEKGVEALRAELGLPTLRPLAAKIVNWVEDPYTLMGFSITPPGAIDAHPALAEPVANRLFWAGEATADHLWKATVHGAYSSGCRAAAEALSASSPEGI